MDFLENISLRLLSYVAVFAQLALPSSWSSNREIQCLQMWYAWDHLGSLVTVHPCVESQWCHFKLAWNTWGENTNKSCVSEKRVWDLAQLFTKHFQISARWKKTEKLPNQPVRKATTNPNRKSLGFYRGKYHVSSRPKVDRPLTSFAGDAAYVTSCKSTWGQGTQPAFRWSSASAE